MKNTAQPVGFTAGPWTAQPRAYSSVCVIWDSLGRRVAETAGLDPDDGRPGAPGTVAGNEANAHLLAAAPDLLSALERILADYADARELITKRRTDTPAMEQARAAIAKARP